MTYHVATTGNDATGTGEIGAPWQTIQKAVNSVTAGDTIEVGGGTFAGFEVESVGGTSISRITVSGQGDSTVINSAVRLEKPYWTIRKVKFIGQTAQQARVKFELFAHNCELLDFTMDNEFRVYHPGIQFSADGNRGEGLAGAFSPDQPSNCRVANGDISGVKGQVCIQLAGSNNIIEDCLVHDCQRVDFLRVWGENNVIRDCQFLRNMSVPEGESVGFHADFVQTFGNNNDGSRGHLFERLLIDEIQGGQICQLVEGTAATPGLIGTGAISDWTFLNCIFTKIDLGASITIPGVKFYNCLFYKNGAGLGLGNSTDRGSAVGWRVKNCVFLDIGPLDRDNTGWYNVPDETKEGHYSDWEADYNFVAKNNYAPVRDSTVGKAIPFRWWEEHGINGGNPGFASSEDFHLIATSLLIGKAVPLNDLFETDFDNVVRGATWDIGPYEAAGTVPPTEPGLPPLQLPLMTQAQRDALDAKDGMMIYQIDETPGARLRENGVWKTITSP